MKAVSVLDIQSTGLKPQTSTLQHRLRLPRMLCPFISYWLPLVSFPCSKGPARRMRMSRSCLENTGRL